MPNQVTYQRCCACGTEHALHAHPDELCVGCQLFDLRWDLEHWQASIWDRHDPEDWPDLRAQMVARRAELYALRDQERRKRELQTA